MGSKWPIFCTIWILINSSLSTGEFKRKKLLENIAENYCEAYCGGICNDEIYDKTCNDEDRNFIATNEYQLKFNDGELEILWNNPHFNGCNLTPITQEKHAKLNVLIVTKSRRDCRGGDYLRQLGVETANRFELHLDVFRAFERRVHYMNGPQSVTFFFQGSVKFNKIHDYINVPMNNLEEIIVNCDSESESQAVEFDANIFKGKPHLKSIAFGGFNIATLGNDVFSPLASLKKLGFSKVTINNLSLMSLNPLQNSLEQLVLDIPQEVDLQHFRTFPQLKLIKVRNYIPYDNLTALLCTPTECIFKRGSNGIACPDVCDCQYNYDYMELEINCSNRGLTQIPPLPIPIIGDSKLIFQNNSLAELPDFSSAGYSNLRRLDVARNQLSNLSIRHLPRKLDYLDISFNDVKQINSHLVEYIRNVSIFKQTGNQWLVYCDDDLLLHLFRDLKKSMRMKAKKLRPIFKQLSSQSPEGFLKFLGQHFLKLGSTRRGYFMIDEEKLGRSMLLKLDDLGKQMYIRESMEWLHRSLSSVNEEYETFYHYHMCGVCPYKCECCQYRNKPKLKVDCRNKFIISFPSINPHQHLVGQKENITDYIELHLANNNISKITTEMLPKNLSYLDLSNNNLESLDNSVVRFLRKLRASAEIKLSGNPWTCHCESRSLLSFLRDEDPKEYTLILNRCNISQDNCPDSCVCCLDKATWPSFIVDCAGEGLVKVPKISRNVGYLDLRNNNISELSPTENILLANRSQASPLKIYMSGNPWSCTCQDVEYLNAIKSISSSIADFTEMTCSSGEKLLSIEQENICSSGLAYYIALAATLAAVLMVTNFLVCFRQPLLIWLYEHDLFLSLATRMELDQDKRYDAFLAFTHKDEDLVGEFVERLEKGRQPFRLCFYLRDWLAGECIPDCISRSVRDSRRIIILMTANFLKSTWGRLEFRLALHATSKDRCKRLIVVVYPDVTSFDDLDSELRAYMVFNTYLERSHPNFWNKLIYSMPHVKMQ
ncbi:protein toll [Drosophila kikkawai]|uniref:Protein toll n=1 Tax=Drosophila kikkawai TaxID=30033 RepID=A0A6P4JP94_DROKI|nr:uncharacterized protein LOC108085384 [Drosophila kikkawai]